MMEIWEKPQMHEVEFAANEYVTVCGDALTNATGYLFIESGIYDGFDMITGSGHDTAHSPGWLMPQYYADRIDSGVGNNLEWFANYHAVGGNNDMDASKYDQMLYFYNDGNGTNQWSNSCAGGHDNCSENGDVYSGWFTESYENNGSTLNVTGLQAVKIWWNNTVNRVFAHEAHS